MSDQPVTKPAAYRALALLSMAALLNGADRTLLPVLAQPIKIEFGLSDSQLGLLTGFAFALLYSIAGIPLGLLADRGPRRTIIAACLTLWSLMTALTGAAQSYLHLLLTRCGVGIGEAGCLPTSYSLISDYFPPEKRASTLGLFLAGNTLGVILGFALGGWLGAQFGWRAAFVICGIPGIALAAIILLIMREPPRLGVAATGKSWKSSLREIWRNRSFRWLTAASSLQVMISVGFSQWLPPFFMRAHDMALSDIGPIFGLIYGGGFGVGLIAGGRWTDRLVAKATRPPMVIAAWLVAPWIATCLITVFSPSLTIAMSTLLIGSIFGGIQSAILVSTIQRICDSNTRATASAVVMLANNLLGVGLITFLIGVLSDLLIPVAGTQSLTYALAASIVVLPLFAWTCVRSARSMASD